MKKDLMAVVSSREVPVVLERASRGVWQVTVEDRMYEVDAKHVANGQWSLLVGQQSFVVDVESRRGDVAVTSGLVQALLSLEDASRYKMAKAAGGGAAKKAKAGAVRAPIAGKVVKLLTGVGQPVSQGAAVIVLEAMKMENEIIAEVSGIVKDLKVTTGQSVETNDLLMVIDAAES